MTLRRPAALLTVALLAPVLGGCLHRKMIIRSTPSDAIVIVDGERLPQRTPATVPFVWDGTRSVTLMASGHKVLDAEADLTPRWYDWFPLDFVAEFLWPFTIEDERVFDYTLVAYQGEGAPVDTAALRARADKLLDDAARFRAGGSDGPVKRVPRADAPPDAPPEGAQPPDEPPPPPLR